MTAVLGVSAHYHDSAAALVVDGKVCAAISEERLSGIKNDASLPKRAIECCLRLAGISSHELDAVVFYENPYARFVRTSETLLRGFPATARVFPRALARQLGSRLWVLDTLAIVTGVARKRVHYVGHHQSHAASAYYASGFADAAVLTVDGVGERETASIWHGRTGVLRKVWSNDFPHSLGLLYAGLTAYLGFEVNEGEYKVMGLAAYGKATYRDAFAKLVRLEGDGEFTLDASYFGNFASDEVGFGPNLEALLGPARQPGKPWNLSHDARDQAFANIAASLQQVTNECMVGLAQKAQRETGSRHLCLAGGVALNAVANAEIANARIFSDVFVQPAAGDAGGALGAAYLGARELGCEAFSPFDVALGVPADLQRMHQVGTQLGLSIQSMGQPFAHAAASLARGEILAWTAGRSEWGPRALGHRSLLADPRTLTSRERINRVIKKREPFRPFAPSILHAQVDAYFEGQATSMDHTMTAIRNAMRSRCNEMPAVVHIDGTARIQSVRDNCAYGKLIEAFAGETGLPMLLNTSLNGPGDPIAATSEAALLFFLRHAVDALYVLNDNGDAIRIER